MSNYKEVENVHVIYEGNRQKTVSEYSDGTYSISVKEVDKLGRTLSEFDNGTIIMMTYDENDEREIPKTYAVKEKLPDGSWNVSTGEVTTNERDLEMGCKQIGQTIRCMVGYARPDGPIESTLTTIFLQTPDGKIHRINSRIFMNDNPILEEFYQYNENFLLVNSVTVSNGIDITSMVNTTYDSQGNVYMEYDPISNKMVKYFHTSETSYMKKLYDLNKTDYHKLIDDIEPYGIINVENDENGNLVSSVALQREENND